VIADYPFTHLFGALFGYDTEAVVDFGSFEAACEVGCLPFLGASVYLDSSTHFGSRFLGFGSLYPV